MVASSAEIQYILRHNQMCKLLLWKLGQLNGYYRRQYGERCMGVLLAACCFLREYRRSRAARIGWNRNCTPDHFA